MTMKKVSGDLAKNRDYLDRKLGVGEMWRSGRKMQLCI